MKMQQNVLFALLSWYKIFRTEFDNSITTILRVCVCILALVIIHVN